MLRRGLPPLLLVLAACKPSAESSQAIAAPTPSAPSSASISADASTTAIAPASSSAASSKPQVRPPPFLVLANSGIGFDDLAFAGPLRTIIAPAAGTGELDLIDEDSFEITKIGGFSVTGYTGGHDDGITSASFDEGHFFVVDRTAREIAVVDVARKSILTRTKLGGSPDYVRWIAATGEAWVTEPGAERIEIFHLESDATLKQTGVIAVKGGPESLIVDEGLGIAFTNLWKGSTLSIDLKKRAIIATWANGCTGSRGIAENPKSGFVFVGCSEGKATVLDTRHDGKIVGTGKAGDHVDIIAYEPEHSHLYVPAAKGATLTVFLVGVSGALEKIGEEDIPGGSHCVTVDDRNDVFLCDPTHGKLVVMHDHWSPKDR